MILVNLPEFILLNLNLKYFRSSMNFKPLSRGFFNHKIISMQTNWGDEYKKLDSFFLPKLVFFTLSLGLMPINIMELQRESISKSWKSGCLFLHMHICRLSTGTKPFLPPHSSSIVHLARLSTTHPPWTSF
jgi:hypothetical protein